MTSDQRIPNAKAPRADLPRLFGQLVKPEGRWITAVMLGAFFLLLEGASLLLHKPVFELPPFAWFGPMPPYFADLRGVADWSQGFRSGIPAQAAHLHDAWNRPFNYPYAWVYAGNLGLNGHTVMAFGYGMAALFLAAAFAVLGPLDAFGGLVAGLWLISYAVLFGLERANVDLLMFALLALALASRRAPPLAALLIAVAAILKLHPLFAFGALLAPPWKKSLPWLAAGLLLVAAGFAPHFHDFTTNMSYAPNMRSGVLSFGMTSLGLEFMERYHHPASYDTVLASGAVTLVLAAGLGAWMRPSLPALPENAREIFAFRIGAGIYLGSFLLGTNHDYRAIFLLFCLPLLLLLLRRNLARPWARATLLLATALLNWLYFAGDDNACDFLLKQGVAWTLFVCLTGLYIATLPSPLQWPRPLNPELPPRPTRATT